MRRARARRAVAAAAVLVDAVIHDLRGAGMDARARVVAVRRVRHVARRRGGGTGRRAARAQAVAVAVRIAVVRVGGRSRRVRTITVLVDAVARRVRRARVDAGVRVVAVRAEHHARDVRRLGAVPVTIVVLHAERALLILSGAREGQWIAVVAVVAQVDPVDARVLRLVAGDLARRAAVAVAVEVREPARAGVGVARVAGVDARVVAIVVARGRSRRADAAGVLGVDVGLRVRAAAERGDGDDGRSRDVGEVEGTHCLLRGVDRTLTGAQDGRELRKGRRNDASRRFF